MVEVEVIKLNGKKYYKVFETREEADKYINGIRPRVLAVGIIA